MLSHMAAAASADPVSPELALVDPALATRLRAVRDVLPTEALEPVTVTILVDLEAGERPESPDPERPPAYDVDDPIADLIVHEPSAQPVEPGSMLTEEKRQTADRIAHEPSPEPVEPARMETDERDPIADLIVHEPSEQPVEPARMLSEEDPRTADLIVHEPSAQPVEPVNMFTEEHEPSADLLVETASPKGEVSGYPSLPQPDAANLEALDAAEAALREIRDRLTEPTSGRERRRFRRRFIVASGLSVAAALGVLAASAALGAATPYS
jgi:hypothetical protein